MSFPQFISKFSTPLKPLNNFDILEKCKSIKNFKGVFMRDELKGKASTSESIILNMDDSNGQGTHWVSLYVKGNNCYYCDSFGFEPPTEIRNYCSGKDGYFNTYKIQARDEIICGHYSIFVIQELYKGQSFHDILGELFLINNN